MREGFCLNRKRKYPPASEEIIFRPALTPLEAAMLPARERMERGALFHAMQDVGRSFSRCGAGGYVQRAKIWVR